MTFDEAMVLTSGISSPTAFDDDECFAFWHLLLRVPKGGTVVEIGSQLGRSSSLILQASRLIGFHPVFIDPWTVQPDFMSSWTRMAHALDTPFTLHMMRTDQALERGLLEFTEISLLLIDGDHTRGGLLADMPMLDLMGKNGLVCAHDYGRESLPDVKEVLDEEMRKPERAADFEFLGVAGTLGMWGLTW